MVYVPGVLGTLGLRRIILGALTLAALKTATPLVGRFPRPAYALARLAGWLVWRLRAGARERVEGNLLPACGGDAGRARAGSLKAFQNVASYYVDLATFPHRDHASFEREHLRLVGEEHLTALFAPGPAIIVSAHTGNPELALIAMAQRGRAWVELVEPLEPPALGREMARLREAGGGRVATADLGGTREALRALRAGGLVALVADRDLSGEGVCTTLLGRRVRLPRGPWELARRTGATVAPLFAARRFADDQTVWIEEPFTVPADGDREQAVAAAAQRWADLLSAHIRRDPGQWTVLEAFWEAHACG